MQGRRWQLLDDNLTQKVGIKAEWRAERGLGAVVTSGSVKIHEILPSLSFLSCQALMLRSSSATLGRGLCKTPSGCKQCKLQMSLQPRGVLLPFSGSKFLEGQCQEQPERENLALQIVKSQWFDRLCVDILQHCVQIIPILPFTIRGMWTFSMCSGLSYCRQCREYWA